MSFAVACGWSLMRSLGVATLGVLIATRLARSLENSRGNGWDRTLWVLVLLPVFIPGLLVGYGYRNFSLSLVHQPIWNEAVYAGLVLLMFLPVGTLILLASPPPPVSPSALHMGRLLGAGGSPRISRRAYVTLWMQSRLFALVPAWAAMFLLTFQETEVAALMQAGGWPEWTFTRLATGTTLEQIVLRLVIVVTIQLLVIAVAALVVVGRQPPAVAVKAAPELSTSGRLSTWAYLLIALTALLVVPGSFVLRGTWEGVSVLAAHPALMEQIGIALLFGVTAGLLAWVLSGWLARSLRQRRRTPIVVLCLLPGLLGAWTLGLSLALLFQQPWLRPVYSTPLPMILGEVLFLLPRAVLVRLLLGWWSDSSAAHMARLLGTAGDAARQGTSAGLLWRLDQRARVWGALLVCYWAYMELSIPSPALLGPPGMTTAPVLLYNQMHYGQIPGLSALVLATLAIPVVSLIVASVVARLAATWRSS